MSKSCGTDCGVSSAAAMAGSGTGGPPDDGSVRRLRPILRPGAPASSPPPAAPPPAVPLSPGSGSSGSGSEAAPGLACAASAAAALFSREPSFTPSSRMSAAAASVQLDSRHARAFSGCGALSVTRGGRGGGSQRPGG
jgi:hypothetical protein